MVIEREVYQRGRTGGTPIAEPALEVPAARRRAPWDRRRLAGLLTSSFWLVGPARRRRSQGALRGEHLLGQAGRLHYPDAHPRPPPRRGPPAPRRHDVRGAAPRGAAPSRARPGPFRGAGARPGGARGL